MAKENEIILRIRTQQDGSVKASIQETEKLKKSTEGLSGAKDKGTEAGKKFHKQEKSLYQTNLSSAKGFSKMKETMTGGGSSSLVAAYATLAANVFAATAAFNALRTAAQVQTLTEGFTRLANESGRSAEVIASNLREIAQNALSMEEALRASSLAISSGFSTQQLEELTLVATNASLALGRNLGDSVDRLIRGVAKLEPEILDELGIMVRLDTAVENYAAQINKSASSLTDFERRQAFLNESITQGQQKFGMMEGSVQLSSWEKLGATFQDLANDVLGFISTAFGPLLNIIASSQTAMLGAFIALGSGILTSMIPALGQLAQRQADRAMQLKQNAALEIQEAEATRIAARAQMEKEGAIKRKGRRDLVGKGESAGIKEYRAELGRVKRDENTRQTNMKKWSGAQKKRKAQELEDLKAYRRELQAIIRQEEKRARLLKAGGSAERGIIGGDAAARASERISGAGAWEGFKIGKEEMGKYKAEMLATDGVQKILGKGQGFLGKIMRWGGMGFLFAGTSVKIFGAALVNAIPFIGQIIFVISLLIQGLKWLFAASEKASKAQENYTKILEGVPEKTEQIEDSINGFRDALYAQTGAIDETLVQAERYEKQLKNMAGINDELMAATMKMNDVLIEEGSGAWTIIGDKVKKFWELIVNKLGPVLQKVGAWLNEAFDFGITDWWAENVTESANYITVIENIKQANEDFKKSIMDLAGEDAGPGLIAIKTRAATKAMEDLADSGKISKEWSAILKASGGDVAKAYELAEKQGIDLADAQLFMKNVSRAVSTEVNRQVNAVTSLGDTFSEAGKKLSQLNTKLAKKNEYREASDSFNTLRDQVREVAKTFGDDKEGFAAHLIKTEAGLGAVEKKIIKMVGKDTNDLAQNIELVAEQFETLADKEETYAHKKAMHKAMEQANKSMNKLLETMTVYQKKLETLDKTGTFKLTGEQEVQSAYEIAAIKSVAIENERKIKLNLIELEYELLALKLSLNTELWNKEGTEMTALGKRLQELHAASKKGSIDAINSTADAALIGVQSTMITQRAGATTKGSLVDRAKAMGANVLTPEEIEKAKKVAKEQNIEISEAMQQALDAGGGEPWFASLGFQEKIQTTRNVLAPMFEDLKKLGPQGELAAAIGEGGLIVASSFDTITDKSADMADRLAAVASVFQQLGAMMAASSKAKIAGIDKEIAAEKKRDGKSRESLAKIKAMEKKKEAIARKAFEMNKKMMIASAIASTAAAVVGVLGKEASVMGFFASIPAMIIGAMGLAQVAIIKKQKFEGGSEGGGVAAPSKINVGKRDPKVDVAKRATRGELAFMRGDRGIGSNANNFVPAGGAAGLRRGYAAGGPVLVGEQGPEVITPTTGGFEVIPNEGMVPSTTSVNFTINTIDSQGVEDFLSSNQGSIINTIRQAANKHGEDFLEVIDTDSVGGG